LLKAWFTVDKLCIVWNRHFIHSLPTGIKLAYATKDALYDIDFDELIGVLSISTVLTITIVLLIK
jgi:hypothetical protein